MRSDKLRQRRVKAVSAHMKRRRGWFNRILLFIAFNLVDKTCPLESAISSLIKEMIAVEANEDRLIKLVDYLIEVVERAEKIEMKDRALVLAKPLFK